MNSKTNSVNPQEIHSLISTSVSIDSLMDEILLLIFSFVPDCYFCRIKLTCKKWFVIGEKYLIPRPVFHSSYNFLPERSIKLNSEFLFRLNGLHHPDKLMPVGTLPMENNFDGRVSCYSACTFPDNYAYLYKSVYDIRIFEDWYYFSLGVGYYHGHAPVEAAKRASTGFFQSLWTELNQSSVNTMKELGRALLLAAHAADQAIKKDKKEVFDAGCCGFLGGFAFPITNVVDEKRWAIIILNVGDSRAFLVRRSTFQCSSLAYDDTKFIDSRDTGGKLGPYLQEGEPDLRNLSIGYGECQEGDFLIITSSATHTNFTIKTPSKTPEEFISTAFKKIHSQHSNLFMEKNNQIFMSRKISKLFVEHSIEITANAREFIIDHPNKRLPDDSMYDGKMGNAECITIQLFKPLQK